MQKAPLVFMSLLLLALVVNAAPIVDFRPVQPSMKEIVRGKMFTNHLQDDLKNIQIPTEDEPLFIFTEESMRNFGRVPIQYSPDISYTKIKFPFTEASTPVDFEAIRVEYKSTIEEWKNIYGDDWQFSSGLTNMLDNPSREEGIMYLQYDLDSLVGVSTIRNGDITSVAVSPLKTGRGLGTQLVGTTTQDAVLVERIPLLYANQIKSNSMHTIFSKTGYQRFKFTEDFNIPFSKVEHVGTTRPPRTSYRYSNDFDENFPLQEINDGQGACGGF